jgi:hypothetical protein
VRKWIQEGPVARRSSGLVRSRSARKSRLIMIPAQRASPGCLTRLTLMGVELGYESVDPDCGAWIDKALRSRGPDNAKVRSSVFRPSSSAVFRAVRSIGDEVRAAGAMRGDDEGLGPECRDPDSG